MTPPKEEEFKTKYRMELSEREQTFLTYFPNTVFTYIADHGELATIHTPVLDLSKQEKFYGTYFSVNGFFDNRRVSENLKNVNAFFADIDYPDKSAPQTVIDAYKNELVMELTDGDTPSPTFIIATKNGMHVYWCLEKPIFISDLNQEQQEALRNQYRMIQEAIGKRFEGDPGARDIARVLRVPGTMHQKNPLKPYPVKMMLNQPDMRYKWSEIRSAFLVESKPEAWAVAGGENLIDAKVKEKIEAKYPRLTRPSYKGLLDRAIPVPEGLRNKALLVVSYACRESGWPLQQTLDHFNDFYALGTREIRKTIHSAYAHSYDFGNKNEVMSAILTAPEAEKLSQVTSTILSKETREKRTSQNDEQKKMFNDYEKNIAERYPYLKYKTRGDFYDYANGLYKPLSLTEMQSIILREMDKDGLVNYRKVSAVNDKVACFRSMENRTFSQAEENADKNILNFKNGLLDLAALTMKDHTPDYLSTVQIPIEYDAAAQCPQWLKFVEEIMDGDMEQVKLLQEVAGYALTTDTSFSKAFIFFGQGANGKSLFTRILSKLVGYENVSNVNLNSLNKQFGLTGLIGKRLNLIDEISGNYFESNVIKAIISGERVSAEIKYRPEPLEFTPEAKLIFSVNELPKINDTTPGLYRRFIIVPFLRSFLHAPDLALESKLDAELPGILNWAIHGLKILRGENRFNETEKNFESMRGFKIENSPFTEFITTMYEPAPPEKAGFYEMQFRDLYVQYREFCFSSGYKPKSVASLSRELAHTSIEGYKIDAVKRRGLLYVSGFRPITNLAGEKLYYPDLMTGALPPVQQYAEHD